MAWRLVSASDIHGRILPGSRVFVKYEGKATVIGDSPEYPYSTDYETRIHRDGITVSAAESQVFVLMQQV